MAQVIEMRMCYSETMVEFEAWDGYSSFAQHVVNEERYFRSPAVSRFIEIVLQTSENRKRITAPDTKYWRAQLGYTTRPKEGAWGGSITSAFPNSRMKPKTGLAKEGRLNPKGISYLYAATDPQTAVSEVRPWHSSLVSVAELKVVQRLDLVDCSVDSEVALPRHEWLLGRLALPGDREKAVWQDINQAFSRPVNPTDHAQLNYIPTQILAEAFKRYRYDGVIYKSQLGDGHNLALFNVALADVVETILFEVRNIECSLAPAGPYPYTGASEQEVFDETAFD